MILAIETSCDDTCAALVGFDSSSTNIAIDHGVGNARRSIVATAGRSL